ncbi:MAG: c-type cytochrome [Fibrobacteria bacterium]
MLPRPLPALALGLALLVGCRGPAPGSVPAVRQSVPDSAEAGQAAHGDAPASTDSISTLPLALQGCRYAGARALVEKYCANCHSSHGTSRSQERAYRSLSVDTYAEWLAASREVPGRVDKDSLQGKIMPPPFFTMQPTQAERKLLAAWVRRGSPNTPDGE